MSQQQRLVQLSAASLALVFSRDESEEIPGGGGGGGPGGPSSFSHNNNHHHHHHHHADNTAASNSSGHDIFLDFRAQNLRSFWNKRLVRAVAEVSFQGWMLDNLVLFVQGNANHLEVLREAWMRRALRSPRGYVIKAVGDLSPVQMCPVPQSQFIPLAEVLCSVISDMNSCHVTVTQEALINHMSKAHPGMTIPTQDILYNALGALIKERKIYHTGEGYFIVTPQTYFITNSVVRDKSWWTSASGDDPPSPPPITYLLSNEACMESHGASAPPVAHCKSCSCFSPSTSSVLPPPPPSAPDQHSVSASLSECTGKSLKWPGRPSDHHKPPAVQHQSTSTAADGQASEAASKTATATTTATTATAASRKDKDAKPGRKFGLSLFWRNAAKKEKPKKEYVSFSGQFPPEEWPVRDEDDLNNLPRDLEHAIIKRINPELTVDNLTRHTVLMKKLEERGERAERALERALDRGDRGVDKGMSTEILSKPRHRQSSGTAAGGGGGRRSAHKTSRSRRKAHSSREKQRDRVRSKAPAGGKDYPEEEDSVPSRLRPEVPTVDEPEHLDVDDGAATDAKCLYKKRIENPFHSLPVKEPVVQGPATAAAPASREQRRREGKDSKASSGAAAGRRDRAGHRSKSWDPHRARATLGEAVKSRTTEDRYDCPPRERRADPTRLSSSRERLSDYGPAYPQSSTLRIDDKLRHQREAEGSWEETERRQQQHRPLLPEPDYRATAADQRLHLGQTSEDDLPSRGPPCDEGLCSRSDEPTTSYATYDPASPWPKLSLQRQHTHRRVDGSTPPAGQEPQGTGGSGAVGNEEEEPVADFVAATTADADGFLEDDHRLYQKVDEDDEEEDDDACSSLFLNEEDMVDSAAAYRACVERYHEQQQFLAYHERGSDAAQYQEPRYGGSVYRDCPPHADAATAQKESSLGPAAARCHPRSGDNDASPPPGTPRRKPGLLRGGERQDASPGSATTHSLDLDAAEAADSSIFDYAPTSEVESDAETLQKSFDEGDGESSARWRMCAATQEATEDEFESHGDRGVPRGHRAGLGVPSGGARGEGEMGESQSITGDSGIDSPRTRVSLASNNTVILEGLKRRGFLQNLEKLHSKGTAIRPQSSLLQLTPVMNV